MEMGLVQGAYTECRKIGDQMCRAWGFQSGEGSGASDVGASNSK